MLNLFRTFQPLVSYLNFRTERSIERKEYRDMVQWFRCSELLIALCDSTQDVYNAETRLYKEMLRYWHVRGFEWHKQELMNKITARQYDILNTQ